MDADAHHRHNTGNNSQPLSSLTTSGSGTKTVTGPVREPAQLVSMSGCDPKVDTSWAAKGANDNIEARHENRQKPTLA